MAELMRSGWLLQAGPQGHFSSTPKTQTCHFSLLYSAAYQGGKEGPLSLSARLCTPSTVSRNALLHQLSGAHNLGQIKIPYPGTEPGPLFWSSIQHSFMQHMFFVHLLFFQHCFKCCEYSSG